MATNGNSIHQDQYANTTVVTDPSSASSNNNLSKDEVGWYFVEQYYTTLSKSPEKLHLFYGKRSQFVYGLEAEVANVSVGRPAIQERIRQLDFQDCKVRISNVDSQASFDNIVIQVIGETSNKSGEPKKFVQTFVLAQQPSGYFVLNDILRYIDEEGDEEPVEINTQDDEPIVESEIPEVPVEDEPVEAEPTAPEEPATQLDPAVVDKKLEEVEAEEPLSTAAAPTPAESIPAPESTTQPETAADSVPDPEKAAEEIAEEDTKKAEAPKDPSPTPVVTRGPAPAAAAAAAAAAPEPEKPKGPPKPMTWASRAAAAAGPAKPVVPLPKTATPPAQPRTAAPAAAPGAAPGSAAQPTEPASEAAASKEAGNEWQTAGADSKRQNRPQSISQAPAEKDGTMGYVKYVTEKVKADDLKAALANYGELIYFDINRSKNCAFVEFASPTGYQAAAAANPHIVNGENIIVEPRRPKAGAYGGSNYQTQNKVPGRGRGGYEGGRSGSQSGGRGGFGGQTRGRGGAQRGRGASQAANP